MTRYISLVKISGDSETTSEAIRSKGVAVLEWGNNELLAIIRDDWKAFEMYATNELNLEAVTTEYHGQPLSEAVQVLRVQLEGQQREIVESTL